MPEIKDVGKAVEQVAAVEEEPKEAPKAAAKKRQAKKPAAKAKPAVKAKPKPAPKEVKPAAAPFVPPKRVRVRVTILGFGMTLGSQAVYPDEIHEVAWSVMKNAAIANPGGLKIELDGEWQFWFPELG